MTRMCHVCIQRYRSPKTRHENKPCFQTCSAPWRSFLQKHRVLSGSILHLKQCQSTALSFFKTFENVCRFPIFPPAAVSLPPSRQTMEERNYKLLPACVLPQLDHPVSSLAGGGRVLQLTQRGGGGNTDSHYFPYFESRISISLFLLFRSGKKKEGREEAEAMVCLFLFPFPSSCVCWRGVGTNHWQKCQPHLCSLHQSSVLGEERGRGGSSAVFFFASSLLQRSVCCVVAFVGYTANCYSSPSLISEKAPHCKCLWHIRPIPSPARPSPRLSYSGAETSLPNCLPYFSFANTVLDAKARNSAILWIPQRKNLLP